MIRTDPVEADKQMLKLNEKLTSWDPADAESVHKSNATQCSGNYMCSVDPILHDEDLLDWWLQIWILLFMAVDKFHEAHARFPGGVLVSTFSLYTLVVAFL